jgi:hypothetical protein
MPLGWQRFVGAGALGSLLHDHPVRRPRRQNTPGVLLREHAACAGVYWNGDATATMYRPI